MRQENKNKKNVVLKKSGTGCTEMQETQDVSKTLAPCYTGISQAGRQYIHNKNYVQKKTAMLKSQSR